MCLSTFSWGKRYVAISRDTFIGMLSLEEGGIFYLKVNKRRQVLFAVLLFVFKRGNAVFMLKGFAENKRVGIIGD